MESGCTLTCIELLTQGCVWRVCLLFPGSNLLPLPPRHKEVKRHFTASAHICSRTPSCALSQTHDQNLIQHIRLSFSPSVILYCSHACSARSSFSFCVHFGFVSHLLSHLPASMKGETFFATVHTYCVAMVVCLFVGPPLSCWNISVGWISIKLHTGTDVLLRMNCNNLGHSLIFHLAPSAG